MRGRRGRRFRGPRGRFRKVFGGRGRRRGGAGRLRRRVGIRM